MLWCGYILNPTKRISSFHKFESNWCPLSVEFVDGTPNRPIQLPIKLELYRFCRDVSDWNGFRASCKSIDTGEYVIESVGGRKVGQQHQSECVPYQIVHQEWQRSIRVL